MASQLFTVFLAPFRVFWDLLLSVVLLATDSALISFGFVCVCVYGERKRKGGHSSVIF